MTQPIPIHDFRTDHIGSTPFRFIALDAGSGYDISLPHRHNYYEIFFFKTGGGIHTIDFNEVPILPSSIHFISPGQVHLMQRDPGATGSILLFSREFYHCSPNHSDELMEFPFLHNNLAVPVIQASSEEFEMFQVLISQLRQEKHEHHPEILRAYLHLILVRCKPLFENHLTAYSKDKETFRKFRALIETHYRTERRPHIYAARLCITEKKLNQLCKATAGVSVGDFIKDRILLEAKRLLHNADHPIKEIGYFLGFEDPSYFNRFFKANTSQTAREFRTRQSASELTNRVK